MKLPKPPSKPYAPYKPTPPNEKVENKIIVGKLTSQEDTQYSIESFIKNFSDSFENVDLSKLKFSMEIDTEYGYYDDVSHNLTIHVYYIELIDNPIYDSLYKNYTQDLKTYNVKYKKYIELLKKWKTDQIKYLEELDKYNLELYESTVKNLKKKLKIKPKV